MTTKELTATRDARRHLAVVFAVFFLAAALRFLYLGFQYPYQLDDYIQYYNYAHFGGGIGALIQNLGLLAARPLAGLMDILVWSRFYDCMWLAVLILTAMLAGAGTLIYGVLRRHFDAGPLVLVVLCLIPLGFEGTYWVSAASRVVCGLFFAALAAWFFQRFADRGRIAHLVLFGVTQLVCFGFYEQAILLSLGLTLMLALLNHKIIGVHSLWGLLSFVNIGLLAGLTSIVGSSALYSGRMAFAWPTTAYYYNEFLPVVLNQMKSAFLGGGFYTTVRGFARGVTAIFTGGGIWYLFPALLLCAGIFILCGRAQGPRRTNDRRGLPVYALCGLMLAVLPMTPFLVLENPWFSLRMTVMSFIGIGMLLDALIAALCGLMRKSGHIMRAGVAAVFALVFMLASVSELIDYRTNYENDQRVLDGLEAIHLQLDLFSDIALINVNPTYLAEQNYYYHEHIHGVTESDWALSGAIRANMRRHTGYKLTPLRTDDVLYRPFDRMSEYEAFFYMDDSFTFHYVTPDTLNGVEVWVDGGGKVVAYIERHADGRVQVLNANP